MSVRVVVASSPRSRPCCSLPRVEGEEVRALAALDVEHLDVLALAHLVGQRGGRVDAEVQPRLGQRLGKLDLGGRPRDRPADLDVQVARRHVPVDDATARRADDEDGVALGEEACLRARRRRRCRTARASHLRVRPRACSAGPLAPHRRAARSSAVVPSAPGSGAPSGVRTVSSATWPPSGSRSVTRSSPRTGTTVAPPARTQKTSKLGSSGLSPPGGTWRRPCDQARAAVVLLSSSAACAMSCSASSRLAAGSSFLTSFSTARRLYVWFQ